jgi:hypothetical protein
MLLTANVVINIILAVQITLMYKIWLEYSMSIGNFCKGTTLLTNSVFKSYLIELLLNMISPYPWFYNLSYPNYNNNKVFDMYMNTPLLTFMMLYRTYHIVKIILNQSMFMSSRGERISKVFGIHHGYRFAIK